MQCAVMRRTAHGPALALHAIGHERQLHHVTADGNISKAARYLITIARAVNEGACYMSAEVGIWLRGKTRVELKMWHARQFGANE